MLNYKKTINEKNKEESLPISNWTLFKGFIKYKFAHPTPNAKFQDFNNSEIKDKELHKKLSLENEILATCYKLIRWKYIIKTKENNSGYNNKFKQDMISDFENRYIQLKNKIDKVNFKIDEIRIQENDK